MLNEGVTFINFWGFMFTLAMGLLMMLLPRRYAVVPVIVTACYITMGQRLMVFSLNFTMMRVLVLFGWARMLLLQEFDIRLNAIDKAMLVLTVSTVVTYTILWGTMEAFINRLGVAFNAVGMYFMFRCFIRDLEDVNTVIKTIALVSLPLAASMLLEKSTSRNIFAIFGGVPEYTGLRDGTLRAQGSFGHPILAGTFGATAVPLFASLWHHEKGRLIAVLGLAAASVITVTSGSSGPVIAYMSAWVALWAWTLRRHMREVRWIMALGILSLHIVMKAPVWFLIERVSIFSGSTGYHRAKLIDSAVTHFSEWWLVGTQSTSHWAWHLFDITNQYILAGVEGGLLTMSLFILVIVLCFKSAGRSVWRMDGRSTAAQRTYWGLGSALFAHAVSFLSVSYFDQNILFWYLLLAMISSSGDITEVLGKEESRAVLSEAEAR